MKRIIQLLRSKISFLLKGQRNQTFYPVEATQEEIDFIELCKPFTMTSYERLWATISSTKYIAKNNIEGAFVECGIWRGGSSMAIASTLLSMDINMRDIYMFDTFEGMTSPTNSDRDIFGQTANSQLSSPKSKESNIWCFASLEDVKDNFSLIDYPIHYLHFIKGDVNETLENESNLPQKIALLRLDTDWYESTKKELEILFPRLVKGGVCLIDDYGHWQGSRKAVDEFLLKHKLFPLMHVTDYTGRAFIKT